MKTPSKMRTTSKWKTAFKHKKQSYLKIKTIYGLSLHNLSCARFYRFCFYGKICKRKLSIFKNFSILLSFTWKTSKSQDTVAEMDKKSYLPNTGIFRTSFVEKGKNVYFFWKKIKNIFLASITFSHSPYVGGSQTWELCLSVPQNWKDFSSSKNNLF